MPTPFPFTTGQVLTAAQMNAITELIINDKTDSYTLVAGDAGEYVVMNKATSTTITVPNNVFSASQIVRIVNKGAGVCTVTAGAGTTVSTTGSLALAQNATGTLIALSASAFIFEAGGVAQTAAALVVVKAETSFSASSSVTIDNVFSATYRNYKAVVNYTTSGVAGVRLRMRVGGSSTSTSTYNEQELLGDNATASALRGSSATSVIVGKASSGSFNSTFELLIGNPFNAVPTTLLSTNVYSSGAYTAPVSALLTGNQSGSTSFDGIELFPSSGTITGNYTIYGLGTS